MILVDLFLSHTIELLLGFVYSLGGFEQTDELVFELLVGISLYSVDQLHFHLTFHFYKY